MNSVGSVEAGKPEEWSDHRVGWRPDAQLREELACGEAPRLTDGVPRRVHESFSRNFHILLFIQEFLWGDMGIGCRRVMGVLEQAIHAFDDFVQYACGLSCTPPLRSAWWVSTTLRQIDLLTLAAGLQQRNQPPVKEESLLDVGVAVVEHLREEGMQAIECSHARAAFRACAVDLGKCDIRLFFKM